MKVLKVKVSARKYHDVELGRIVFQDEVLEVSEARAEKLSGLNLVEVIGEVEVEAKPKKETKPKAEKKSKKEAKK